MVAAGEQPPRTRRKFIVRGLGLAGAVVFMAMVVLLAYPDSFINAYIKGPITEALRKAYPATSMRMGTVHFEIWDNRLGADSVVLEAVDSSWTCSAGTVSISGVGWLRLLLGDGVTPGSVAAVVIEARDIDLVLPASSSELRCAYLRISVPDSEVTADSLALHPSAGDQEFFRGSAFRQTRLSLSARQTRATGVAFLAALDRKSCRVRSVHVRDMQVDVLVNKDKPAQRDSLPPAMPAEILAAMKGTVQCDSVTIVNGALKYGERVAAGLPPAVITLDSSQVAVAWTTGRESSRDTLLIDAQGALMNSGKAKLALVIPISSPAFSLQYSGSLGAMDLRRLNRFLEIAEGTRFTAGALDTATFDITVVDGRAHGSVRAVYRDLNIAAIDNRTGSAGGVLNSISSFMANTVKLRTENIPDPSGAVKMGQVQYRRQHDDPFFRYVWFALRSGVGDLVGF
jgi:hypothetical protein